MFTNRHFNRLTFPTRHVVVCEDDLNNQAAIAKHLAELFGGQGDVQVSFVPGAVMAAAVIEKAGAELILLDHDMPFGSGNELLNWLASTNRQSIPVITFSGILDNNTAMMEMGARYKFNKTDVIDGLADALMKSILGL